MRGFFESLEKAGAEKGLLWSEIGLLCFGALLVVGLIGEWQKEKDERWKGLSDTFELLVIIGVVGELIFDGLIFGFSGRLSVIQDAAVVVATDRASEATTSAGNANKAAGEANKLAGEANERAAEANERAKGLDLQLQEAKLELQKGQTRLGGRLSDIEEKTRGRDVKDKQRRIVVNGINGHRRLLVVMLLDDKEPRAYGTGIADTLTKAHFAVRKTDFGHTSPARGVIVCENGSADLKLFRVLKQAGIATEVRHGSAPYDANRPTECQQDFTLPSGATRIFVGQRE